MKERETKPAPQIIDEINKYLQKIPSPDHDMRNFTVERIAEAVGISQNILYKWVMTDSELQNVWGNYVGRTSSARTA